VETVFLSITIIFVLFMVFTLFKYANFIHHYSDHGKQDGDSANSSQVKEENKEP
jgi:cbb3-type cytochrome oxidase subunit 3